MIAIIPIVMSGCKKSEKSDPVPITPYSMLCHGIGSQSYWPLALDNKWTFKLPNNSLVNLTVVDTVLFNSNLYYKLINDYNSEILYLRTQNNNVVSYDPASGNTEYIIPATLYDGYTWNNWNSSTSVMINTSTTFHNDSCSYENVVSIRINDQWQIPISYSYYKKGIGMVGTTKYGGGNEAAELVGLKLY